LISRLQTKLEPTLRKALAKVLTRLPDALWWRLRVLRKPFPYFGDDMVLRGRLLPFQEDPAFVSAFRSAIGFAPAYVGKLDVRWRALVCVWAARQALLTEGDFVECGVNTGILSGTICRALNFDQLDRQFYLFDTYNGIPVEQANAVEAGGVLAKNTRYKEVFDVASENFRDFHNAILVRGRVPESLETVKFGKIAYLSLDMNIMEPERAAFEALWPRVSPGGVVVFDDIGFVGHEEQRTSALALAAKVHRPMLFLPTGQGLLIK
jgi:O-methyltransferase